MKVVVIVLSEFDNPCSVNECLHNGVLTRSIPVNLTIRHWIINSNEFNNFISIHTISIINCHFTFNNLISFQDPHDVLQLCHTTFKEKQSHKCMVNKWQVRHVTVNFKVLPNSRPWGIGTIGWASGKSKSVQKDVQKGFQTAEISCCKLVYSRLVSFQEISWNQEILKRKAIFQGEKMYAQYALRRRQQGFWLS